MDIFPNNPVLGHIPTFGGHPVSGSSSFGKFESIDFAKYY